MEVEALDVPFAVVPNAQFPDATPVCVLSNLNSATPALDTYIKSWWPFPGPTAGTPESADPWQVEFRWQTKGGTIAGTWHLDAWLHSFTFGPNIQVPGFPLAVPAGAPFQYDAVVDIPEDAFPLPDLLPPPFPPGEINTAKLYRLVTTIRFAPAGGPLVRVVGRGIGPIIEFYRPLI
jgi:hypothetical protein